MCARVCPTETLCEEACVREAAEGRPVEIGRLQRYRHRRADGAAAGTRSRAPRRPASGWRWSAPGRRGSPARTGWRCSATTVVLIDARPKGGGLNEFGIAAYKAVDGFAQAEVDWLLGIGGIERAHRRAARARRDARRRCARSFDAVFLGIGLGGVRALEAEGAARGGRAAGGRLHRRAAPGRAISRALPVGRRVVVIGGGMTAIDAGGAGEEARRRGGDDRLPPRPRADGRERLRAGAGGERGRAHRLRRGAGRGDAATARCARSSSPIPREGRRAGATGERFALAADQVLTAIGQRLGDAAGGAGGRGRQDRGRPGRGAPACPGSGPAATAPAAATT